MKVKEYDVTVAGHICLDLIPSIPGNMENFKGTLTPGNLITIGEMLNSTGGAVSNTGLALHRLGVSTQLMGKVGDDLFGQGILSHLSKYNSSLTESMIVAPGEQTSYSVVLNLEGMDRVFLHCPGTNNSFSSSDLNLDCIKNSRLFHLGYPPLMKKLYENDGHELEKVLQIVKKSGLTVTLDMSKPDPQSDSGKVDWKSILKRVLPYVDFFFPSFEEILYMVNREKYEKLHAEHSSLLDGLTPELLEEITTELINWGTAAVMVKLGEHGLYIRTTSDEERLNNLGKGFTSNHEQWLGREAIASPFKVSVIGTTGAGDCTIAGFLTGLVKGFNFEQTVSAALAVGAHNVEHVDATSGIPKWNLVRDRMEKGWTKLEVNSGFQHWRNSNEIWYGENDTYHNKTVRE